MFRIILCSLYTTLSYMFFYNITVNIVCTIIGSIININSLKSFAFLDAYKVHKQINNIYIDNILIKITIITSSEYLYVSYHILYFLVFLFTTKIHPE